MLSATLDDLLETTTEAEFFIRMCALLDHYRFQGIISSTALVLLNDTAHPGLEFSLSMVLPHADGEVTGWGINKVWVFTLYADGVLSWRIAHYEPAGPKGLSQPRYSRLDGLRAIQDHLRAINGEVLPTDLLPASLTR